MVKKHSLFKDGTGTPSGGDGLTQGCSIEWGEDSETNNNSVELRDLFQSPDQVNNRYDAFGRDPGSEHGVSSASSNLATQPSGSHAKEKRVEDEVDYIYSRAGRDSDEAEEKKSDSESVSKTPKVQNTKKIMEAGEFGQVLTAIDSDGRVTGRTKIAGASQRKKRRQMLERKRLFHEMSESKQNRKKNQRIDVKNIQIQNGETTTTICDGINSFEGLLNELSAESTEILSKSNDGSNNDLGDLSGKQASETLLDSCIGIEPTSSNPCTNEERIECISKTTVSMDKETDDFDDFEDMDFNDDVFAALDAAVLERQTQSGTQLTLDHGDKAKPSNQKVRPSSYNSSSFSLERSATLPTSNKSCDVGDRCSSSLIPAAANGESSQIMNGDAFPSEQSCSGKKRGNSAVKIVASEDNGSDFDDFGDFDFNEIDNLVAQRRCGRKSTEENKSSEVEFTSCTRYRIRSVDDDVNGFTKRLGVVLWCDYKEIKLDDKDDDFKIHNVCGFIHLHDEWYYSECDISNVIHICSLNGRYDTSPLSLPLHISTTGNDDLVIILHPDDLVTPTAVSEAVSCPRRAILKTRYGSSGLSSKPALLGTMRHELFEMCLLHNNFSREFAKNAVRTIVRNHGDKLIGAGLVNEKLMNFEVLKIMPNIRKFAEIYTKFTINDNHAILTGVGMSPSIEVLAERLHGTEEFAISPELGIKGFIDASVEVESSFQVGAQNYGAHVNRQRSFMGIELKTGHNQTPQGSHLAQLALYTLALRTRYGSMISNGVNRTDSVQGAACGGMLLYLNHASLNAVHVSPELNELKTLLNQRNTVASDTRKASMPRGIKVEYDKTNEGQLEGKKISVHAATPANLPEVISSSRECERCYSNRECMLNVAVENTFSASKTANRTPIALLKHFTGHLDKDELLYLKEWDRLIDLEASVNNKEITKAWLATSSERECSTGKTLSSMVFDQSTLCGDTNDADIVDAGFVIKCHRSEGASSTTPLNALRFEVGSRIVISTDGSTVQSSSNGPAIHRPIFGISRGTIKDIDCKYISVKLTHADFRRISNFQLGGKNTSEILFRLDKEDFTTGTSTLRQNLANLFTSDIVPFTSKTGASQETLLNTQQRLQSRAALLRRSIIHLDSPHFEDNSIDDILRTHDNMKILSREFSRLNIDQKQCVNKVITARNYSLIQGFPGTGKSSTIVFIARLMVALGKRVLITSYTHAAVDNIMLKLVEVHHTTNFNCKNTINTDLVRVGSRSAVHPDLHRILVPELAAKVDAHVDVQKNATLQTNTIENTMPTISSLHEVISAAKIVGVSALTVPKSPLLIGQKFDVVIVDEAGQISQPAIIGALLAADSFVLVGDHEQLPPLVQSDVAQEAGYSDSMLKRLAEKHPSDVAQLTLQYRMHEDICLLSNLLVYNGLLKCGNDIVRVQKLTLSHFPRALKTKIQPTTKGLGWLLPVLNPNKPVVFVNTDKLGQDLEGSERGRGAKNGVGVFNDTEVSLAGHVIDGLRLCGLQAEYIGVISPYRSQVNRLEGNSIIKSNTIEGVEVSTIDKYQGRDKDAIILSFVRSNIAGKTGRLIEDKRRLNVALSRAKMKLIIIGSYNTLLKGSSVLSPVLREIKNRGWVEHIPHNACSLYNVASSRKEP